MASWHEPPEQSQANAEEDWGTPFPSFSSHSPQTLPKPLPAYPSLPPSGGESPSSSIRAKPALPPKSTRALDQVTRKISTGSRLTEMLSELGTPSSDEGSGDLNALIVPYDTPSDADPTSSYVTVKAPPRRLGEVHPSLHSDTSHQPLPLSQSLPQPLPYSTARPSSGRTSGVRPAPPSSHQRYSLSLIYSSHDLLP